MPKQKGNFMSGKKRKPKPRALILPLLLLGFSLTITNCRTLPAEAPALPPRPQRQAQEIPKTEEDWAALLVYYESLVREWEAWADAAEAMR